MLVIGSTPEYGAPGSVTGKRRCISLMEYCVSIKVVRATMEAMSAYQFSTPYLYLRLHLAALSLRLIYQDFIMASESNSNGTVPVSLRDRETNTTTKPPVWPLDSTEPHTSPLLAKCGRNDRRDGICCKDLKDDDDRTLINPDIVRDVLVVFLKFI